MQTCPVRDGLWQIVAPLRQTVEPTQPAKVTPFAGVTELPSEKAPKANFSNEQGV
jgi:hypothetical protein